MYIGKLYLYELQLLQKLITSNAGFEFPLSNETKALSLSVRSITLYV
jgi:hypothetical protein